MFQSANIDGSEFCAPKADRLADDGEASFGQDIFNIPMAEVEATVEPDGIGDDVGRESMALVSIHGPIRPISAV